MPSVITDRLLIGLAKSKIQQILLSKSDLNFDRCCEIATNMEMSRKEQETIANSRHINSIRQRNERVNTVREFVHPCGQDHKILRKRKVEKVNHICPSKDCDVSLEGIKVTMKVDTGSPTTIISLDEYKNRLNISEIEKYSNELSSITGNQLNVCGLLKEVKVVIAN